MMNVTDSIEVLVGLLTGFFLYVLIIFALKKFKFYHLFWSVPSSALLFLMMFDSQTRVVRYFARQKCLNAYGEEAFTLGMCHSPVYGQTASLFHIPITLFVWIFLSVLIVFQLLKIKKRKLI